MPPVFLSHPCSPSHTYMCILASMSLQHTFFFTVRMSTFCFHGDDQTQRHELLCADARIICPVCSCHHWNTRHHLRLLASYLAGTCSVWLMFHGRDGWRRLIGLPRQLSLRSGIVQTSEAEYQRCDDVVNT